MKSKQVVPVKRDLFFINYFRWKIPFTGLKINAQVMDVNQSLAFLLLVYLCTGLPGYLSSPLPHYFINKQRIRFRVIAREIHAEMIRADAFIFSHSINQL